MYIKYFNDNPHYLIFNNKLSLESLNILRYCKSIGFNTTGIINNTAIHCPKTFNQSPGQIIAS